MALLKNSWARFETEGSGTVDSVVASDTRGPRFESRHRQLLLDIIL